MVSIVRPEVRVSLYGTAIHSFGVQWCWAFDDWDACVRLSGHQSRGASRDDVMASLVWVMEMVLPEYVRMTTAWVPRVEGSMVICHIAVWRTGSAVWRTCLSGATWASALSA